MACPICAPDVDDGVLFIRPLLLYPDREEGRTEGTPAVQAILSPLSPMRGFLFLASPTAISHFTVRLPYCSTELDVKSSPHKCCTALGCPVQLWNELRLCGYKRNITPPKAFNGLITIKIAVCKGTEGTG